MIEKGAWVDATTAVHQCDNCGGTIQIGERARFQFHEEQHDQEAAASGKWYHRGWLHFDAKECVEKPRKDEMVGVEISIYQLDAFHRLIDKLVFSIENLREDFLKEIDDFYTKIR